MTSADEDRKVTSESGGEDLPHIDFSTFVLSLSHNGFVHLGDAPESNGMRPPANLELARQTIDLLSLLEEKTRGNLSGEEERMLSAALYDLRSRFAEVSRGT